MALPSKNRLRLLARFFAMASVLVMLGGRFVHVHQVGGDSAVETASQTQQANSHHSCSCSRHATDQHGDRDSKDDSDHDHHNCGVCSLFAITPVTSDVVDLPQTTNDVCVTVELYSASPRSLAPQVSRLRGPPASPFCS